MGRKNNIRLIPAFFSALFLSSFFFCLFFQTHSRASTIQTEPKAQLDLNDRGQILRKTVTQSKTYSIADGRQVTEIEDAVYDPNGRLINRTKQYQYGPFPAEHLREPDPNAQVPTPSDPVSVPTPFLKPPAYKDGYHFAWHLKRKYEVKIFPGFRFKGFADSFMELRLEAVLEPSQSVCEDTPGWQCFVIRSVTGNYRISGQATQSSQIHWQKTDWNSSQKISMQNVDRLVLRVHPGDKKSRVELFLKDLIFETQIQGRQGDVEKPIERARLRMKLDWESDREMAQSLATIKGERRWSIRSLIEQSRQQTVDPKTLSHQKVSPREYSQAPLTLRATQGLLNLNQGIPDRSDQPNIRTVDEAWSMAQDAVLRAQYHGQLRGDQVVDWELK